MVRNHDSRAGGPTITWGKRLLISMVLLVALASCAAPTPTPTPTPPPEPTASSTPAPTATAQPSATAVRTGDAAQGELLLNRYCVPCHGEEGSGGHYAPSLMDARMARKTDAELRSTILNGRGGSMPSWRDVLTEDEIGDILAFLRERQG